MTPAALRIVNEVSYVMMIKQASHFVVLEYPALPKPLI